jgi:drug/metabolite transporter (DMT)-like permease
MPSVSSTIRRLEAIPDPIQGALFMTASAFCFAVMNVFIREVSAELHPFQIAFFRNFFAFLFILPWLASAGWGGLKTKRMGMQVWRAIIGVIAMGCWFTAITLVPLADAVALNFTLPLFATAGAAVFLSEKVGVRRWSAAAVGFLGMLIILRPGFLELTPAMFLPIIAAVFMATSVLILKSLSDTENPNAMVFYMNLFMTPISLVPALFFWQWPSWAALGLLAMLGFVAMLAHLSLARAYGKADASAVMPFDYARLPFVAVIAFFLYGEVADLWTWAGAAVIAGAAFYIARREALVALQRPASRAAGESVRVR